MTDIHDRMPVIVPPAAYARWLTPEETPPEDLVDLLDSYPAEEDDGILGVNAGEQREERRSVADKVGGEGYAVLSRLLREERPDSKRWCHASRDRQGGQGADGRRM